MGTQPATERGTAAPPHFSVHIYCGRTAGWIRIPLDTEIGDIVLDGDPALPTKRGTAAPPPLSVHVYCDLQGHATNADLQNAILCMQLYSS